MTPEETLARSDAAFDGRPFDGLPRHERDRYLERARIGLGAVVKSNRKITDMPKVPDIQDHRRAVLDCVMAHLQEHPECVDKDVDTGGETSTFARDGRWVTVAYVSIEGARYAVEVTRL